VHVGIQMAQVGPAAGAAAVRTSAQAAEALGYHSVWTRDRLLAPQKAGAGDGDGHADSRTEPVRSLDPLATLAFVAAVTERVRLGTSVLVGPWYPPVLLARTLASLDVLSGGRLTVGLGLGWSADECAAAGVGRPGRAARQDELLDVLGAAWGPERIGPVDGADPVPCVGLRPLPRPRPPILLAGSTPAALERVARRADGWNPTGVPVERLAPMWSAIRDRAGSHGREPNALLLVVRAEITLQDRPVRGERPSYVGDVDQVASDLEATRRAGAHEVILATEGDGRLDRALDTYAAVAEALELRAAARDKMS
jgi:probable F420-dependent oxidoreductase